MQVTLPRLVLLSLPLHPLGKELGFLFVLRIDVVLDIEAVLLPELLVIS